MITKGFGIHDGLIPSRGYGRRIQRQILDYICMRSTSEVDLNITQENI